MTLLPKTKKRAAICMLFLLLLTAVGGVMIIYGMNVNKEVQIETDAGYERQAGEEEIADVFIKYLIDHAEDVDSVNDRLNDLLSETDPNTGKPKQIERTDKDIEMPAAKIEWWDEQYWTNHDGVVVTPDYATGYLAFVLEYPAIGIRRGVYCDTSYAGIMADVDKWMTVLFSPKMELGKTHLVIMGHNHLAQNLSFNNVRNSKIGDHFTLYGTSGVYEYEIVNIFCEWRSSFNTKYVSDFTTWDNTDCFIATCGRDDMYLPNGQSTRYRDFVLHGKLVKHYTLSEYGKLLIEDENDWRDK